MRASRFLDTHEIGKRLRRTFDNKYSCRKIFILIVVFGGALLYFGSPVLQWIFSSNREPTEAFEDECINERLASYYFDAAEYNAHILHDPPMEDEQLYLPYIGNGIIGTPVASERWLYIKEGRGLSLPVHWYPLVSHAIPDGVPYREATVTQFTKGLVQKYQCFSKGYRIEYQYYVHTNYDGLLVQNLKIVNPSNVNQQIAFKPQTSAYWTDSVTEAVRIQVDGLNSEYNVISGHVALHNSNKVIVVSIVYRVPPKVTQVKPLSTTKFDILTSIQYSEPVTSDKYYNEREVTKKRAIEVMKKALIHQQRGLRDEHTATWQSYWFTGFRISNSKAKGAINGHKINSTMYYVLSQVPRGSRDVEKSVANSEGCYRGHHTLDAPRLWKNTATIEDINEIVDAWLLTLEKQGCHHLMSGGPAAVQQAVVLSLGGLRFSNQHLEFNIDPQYLHRDYLFRRISYGNMTHLNVTVTVGDDNRAMLAVALDKSDSNYYGCDAGCLDDPVPLSPSYTKFPVKLTKPLTAILYITADYQHMQDLRNALHVHAVDEAPAHDHHVMALHKHGHQLGGLPTLFWVSIGFLIVVFHLFLFKLIIAEFCESQDRQRTRYSKL